MILRILALSKVDSLPVLNYAHNCTTSLLSLISMMMMMIMMMIILTIMIRMMMMKVLKNMFVFPSEILLFKN